MALKKRKITIMENLVGPRICDRVEICTRSRICDRYTQSSSSPPSQTHLCYAYVVIYTFNTFTNSRRLERTTTADSLLYRLNLPQLDGQNKVLLVTVARPTVSRTSLLSRKAFASVNLNVKKIALSLKTYTGLQSWLFESRLAPLTAGSYCMTCT